MKKYIVGISENAKQDLENIISYLRHSMTGDIIADKYKILFKQGIEEFVKVTKKLKKNYAENTNYLSIGKCKTYNYDEYMNRLKILYSSRNGLNGSPKIKEKQ